MTNIIQYLDICQNTLKRLQDPGLRPIGMTIELNMESMGYLQMLIQAQGEWVTAQFVETPFKAEIVNKGLVKLSRQDYTFHLTLKNDLRSR